VGKSLAQALKWYRLAAEQQDAPAQYALGTLYRDGLGVKKNASWRVNGCSALPSKAMHRQKGFGTALSRQAGPFSRAPACQREHG
jgi:TPR repeat protein